MKSSKIQGKETARLREKVNISEIWTARETRRHQFKALIKNKITGFVTTSVGQIILLADKWIFYPWFALIMSRGRCQEAGVPLWLVLVGVYLRESKALCVAGRHSSTLLWAPRYSLKKWRIMYGMHIPSDAQPISQSGAPGALTLTSVYEITWGNFVFSNIICSVMGLVYYDEIGEVNCTTVIVE